MDYSVQVRANAGVRVRAYTAEQFSAVEDLQELHQIADAAARNAGVPAYWVGCSCMPETENLQEDVSTVHSFYTLES